MHNKGKIYLGATGQGFHLKKEISSMLEELGEYLVVDLGVFEIGDQATCEDIGREVGEKVLENGHREGSKTDHLHGDDVYGILISGEGCDLAEEANKMDGIRAVYGDSDFSDANILALGSQSVSFDEASELIHKFLG